MPQNNMQPNGDRFYIPLSRKVDSFSRATQAGHGSIYRVHSHLREVNKRAYEPEIIAIGPYHHGKDELAMMEEHKLRYLHNLLQRKGGNVDRYIEAIRQHKEKVRNFYGEPLRSLTSDELVEMMVLDGCFIIELVRKFRVPYRMPKDSNDPIFKMRWMVASLMRDLMLFENQLPFLVLQELFRMVEAPDNETLFKTLLLNFFFWILPDPMRRWSNPEYSLDTVRHLLDFVHINWLPPLFPRDEEIPNNESDSNTKSLIMRSATELREAGVKFEKIEGQHFFDICFTNGTLEIPTIEINDFTDAFLRNLIAHEQYRSEGILTDNGKMTIADYAIFMDDLINSSKDVEILRHHGIIDNQLGDDEVVSDIFNKIGDSVTLHLPADGRYAVVVTGLHSHCNKRRHRWMAMLRHNIFTSPWAIISFVAAAILLILTATQTTFTVFPRN